MPGANCQADDYKEIVHQVEVYHPGQIKDYEATGKLVELHKLQGQTVEFYMDVESVICEDSLCKIVIVRIFWDRLGFYTRYELAPGIQLEKAEGKPFTSDDHEKLHKILQQTDSPFKELFLGELVSVEDGPDIVDGRSGATIALSENASVKGAVWTCYTLWHWANGCIVPIIRQITAQACNLNDLMDYLKKGEENHKVFAMQELKNRGAYDGQSVEAVLNQTTSEDLSFTKLALKYLEPAPSEIYYSSLNQLFKEGNSKQRIMYLNSLLTTRQDPSPEYYMRFSQNLCDMKSYQEVDMLLNLFEREKFSSAELNKQAICLLEGKDFLIARRAYWFLNNQTLTASQNEILEAFRLQYSEML
ncbi:hypothetical protein ACFLSP_05275 [Bacteroidota bacterium]